MKYILFAFTLAFVVFGILLIYTGLSTFVRLNKYELVIHNAPDNATIALLVVGFVIFFISFLGCCGALMGNDLMLRTFSFIMTVLIIIEISSVGIVYAFRNTIRSTMDDGIDRCITKYNETNQESAFTKLLDDIQVQWHCCGAESYHDWQNNTAYNGTVKLPRSCCPMDNASECTVHSAALFTQGCVPILTEEVKNSVSALFWVAIIVCVIQILGIIFSCSVVGQRREYSYV